MKKHRRWIGILALLLAAAPVLGAMAAGDDLEERASQAESRAKSLEEASERLAGYLSDLEAQLDDLDAELEALAAQKTELETQLAGTEQELEAAKETESTQYASMKKRIQYMYENRDGGFVGLIFSEDSLSGILNKAEYAVEMADYDRNMLMAYKATKELVAQKESDLRAEQTNLDQNMADTQEKQNEVLAAIADTADKMDQCSGDLEDTKGQLAQYRSELQKRELEAEDKLAQIENGNQTADNRPDSSQNGSQNSGNSSAEPSGEAPVPTQAPPQTPTEAPTQAPTSAPTQAPAPTEAPTQAPTQSSDEFDYSAYSDLELMAAMIYREANMEPWEGKVAVGNVIMNRIASSRYPNTMLGVLSQKRQFSPWGYPKYQKALKNGVPSECTRAAQVAMSGSENYIGGLLHFRTVLPGYDGIIIGSHVFY